MHSLFTQVITANETMEIIKWLAIFIGLYTAGRIGIRLILGPSKSKCGCGFWMCCPYHSKRLDDRDEELKGVGR